MLSSTEKFDAFLVGMPLISADDKLIVKSRLSLTVLQAIADKRVTELRMFCTKLQRFDIPSSTPHQSHFMNSQPVKH